MSFDFYSGSELVPFAEIFGFVRAFPNKATASATDTEGMANNELWLTSYPEPVSFHYSGYTSDTDIYSAMRTAIPAPISRSAITYTLDPRDTEVTVTVASARGLAQQLLASMNNDYRVIIIAQSLSAELQNYTLFRGGGVPTTFEGNGAVIKARADRYILDLLVPDVVYQRQCNCVLFDSRCGLTQADWCVTIPYGEFTEVTGGLYHKTLESYDENHFYLGQVVVGSWATSRERRLVTYSGSGTVLFSPLFERTLDATENIIISPGCDKFFDTCSTKFNNTANFLGMPEMPTKNPSIQGI